MRRLLLAWRRLDRSLQARILIPTAILFAGTMAIMVMASVQIHLGDMRRGQIDRARLLVRMAAAAIAPHLGVGDSDESISAVLRAMASEGADVEALSFSRPGDGPVVASSQPLLVGTQPWRASPGADRSALLREPASRDGPPVIVGPVEADKPCPGCAGPESRTLGWVEVRLSETPLVVARRRLARTLALSAASALALLIGISWWLFGREAVNPLRRLVKSMRLASGGDLGVRADEGRADEIGAAARGFNSTLTALREALAKLEATYEEGMVRADRFAAVGELAAALAHEIKNPLAGLSGALELLAEDLKEAPRQGEVVTEMRHQVDRLIRIMESLLSFARPQRVQLQSTDVNATLEKVLFLVGQQRQATPIVIDRVLAPDLPPVPADPAQLEQVFLNISLNAMQAMKDKGGCLHVRSARDGDHVVVEIGDDGAGIPEPVRSQVFKPFFTTKHSGTGLGLAICARVIRDHGGRISFRCPAEGGTVFSVGLRLAGPPPGERAA